MGPMRQSTDSPTRNRCSDAGYTLLEVLLAMTIFMIGILAIGSMQTAALKGNASSRGVTEAVNLAQGQVEQLMAIEYDPASVDPALDPAQNNSHVRQSGDYTVRWIVSNHPTLANALSVQVAVSWFDAGIQKRVIFDFIKNESV
jgi:type IV pilus assembly protein PilV